MIVRVKKVLNVTVVVDSESLIVVCKKRKTCHRVPVNLMFCL